MIRFVDKVILPYVEGIIEDLLLSQKNQKAVTILDVYRAHTGEKLLSHLKKNDIISLFVPAACTDKLQPLDLSVNREYKEQLKSNFHDWYSAQVVQQLNHQEDITGERAPMVIVDLKTSVMKPVHAQWIVSTPQIMSTRTDQIKSGFRKAVLYNNNAFFCYASTTPLLVAYKLNDRSQRFHLCPNELMSFPTSKNRIKPTPDNIGRASAISCYPRLSSTPNCSVLIVDGHANTGFNQIDNTIESITFIVRSCRQANNIRFYKYS
ncbi:unnamed protein product [Mytilus coruscus]|uniref:DDE-1 domain-containing protein n=1 Tax=Mytilus coruscus TaxID=42192 RepID=A0A6J8DK53_MYTCO|nr:unnamed protein product [Mytilus coruscus]